MQWEEVRKIYPDQYVKLQILASHTEGNTKFVDEVALIRAIQNPKEATKELLEAKDGVTLRFTVCSLFRQSPLLARYSPQTASPYVHSPVLRSSWLPGSCLAHGFPPSHFFHGFELRTSLRLLGQSLHRRLFFLLRADSLAFAAFPASFFTTIPTSDFSPSVLSS